MNLQVINSVQERNTILSNLPGTKLHYKKDKKRSRKGSSGLTEQKRVLYIKEKHKLQRELQETATPEQTREEASKAIKDQFFGQRKSKKVREAIQKELENTEF